MAERTKKSERQSDLASVSLGELIHRCSPRVKGGDVKVLARSTTSLLELERDGGDQPALVPRRGGRKGHSALPPDSPRAASQRGRGYLDLT